MRRPRRRLQDRAVRRAAQPQLRDVRRVAAHPQFDMQGDPGASRQRRRRAAAAGRAAARQVARSPLGVPLEPIARRPEFHRRRHRRRASAATARAAARCAARALIATGRPAGCRSAWSIRRRNNARDGLGACTGDSGGPVLQQQDGRAIVIGVVSWSTGAEQRRRLRRPHRRHPADAVSRLDRDHRAQLGRRAGKVGAHASAAASAARRSREPTRHAAGSTRASGSSHLRRAFPRDGSPGQARRCTAVIAERSAHASRARLNRPSDFINHVRPPCRLTRSLPCRALPSC